MAWIDTMVMNSAPWFGTLPGDGSLWMVALLVTLAVPAAALVRAGVQSALRSLPKPLPEGAAAAV